MADGRAQRAADGEAAEPAAAGVGRRSASRCCCSCSAPAPSTSCWPSRSTASILMSFVVVVIGISIYQEHKTENALAALRDLSSPRALVLRDGAADADRRAATWCAATSCCSPRATGCPPTASLLECVNLSVDESALTGESVPVRKAAVRRRRRSPTAMGRPGGDATPWVFSGTLVVKGHGIALVKETGAGTELGRIGTALRTIETGAHPAAARDRPPGADHRRARPRRRGRRRRRLRPDPRRLARRGCSPASRTAMAMLPEEFPVVLTVFLALGAWRLSQKHVLTRRTPVHRDARLGDRHLRRQDRHADDEPDDRARAHRRRRDARDRRRTAARAVPRDRRVRRARLAGRPVRPDGHGLQGARRAVPGRRPSTCTPTGNSCASTRSRSSCWRSRTCGARRTATTT